MREGVIINIDHLDEIIALEEIAKATGKEINIGMRLNLDAGISLQLHRRARHRPRDGQI